jgi:hypothetical protein
MMRALGDRISALLTDAILINKALPCSLIFLGLLD